MAKNLRLLFSDQLTHDLSSLVDIDKKNDVVLMIEAHEEVTYVPHHKQKLAFIFSAMRHFAKDLSAKKIKVEYVKIDDKANKGSLDSELKRMCTMLKPERVVLTEPSEYRLHKKVEKWQRNLKVAFEVRNDDRFFCDAEKFAEFAKGKKQLRLENFYRMLRQQTGILMTESGKPEQGKWNFDAENRKPWNGKPKLPPRPTIKLDAITNDVIKTVNKIFPDHFGATDKFHWAVTRKEALARLKHFLKYSLPNFGNYQDAMHSDDAFLFHSLLSPYLNAGLLSAKEVCLAVEIAYLDGDVPINAAEGFIRQILGWREFIRGIYWLHMPQYAKKNFLKAKRKLPDFYWTAETDLNCIKNAVEQTRDYAYSHHIQRLMVTGNFGLLAGIDVQELCEWYLLVYADAYDWVELPNTLGMSLYGDGGVFASKPYAASGKYINRMSNYCKGCKYNPNESIGDTACPFNSLYWHFMHKHRNTFAKNQRLTYTYASWNKMTDEKKKALLVQAKKFLSELK